MTEDLMDKHHEEWSYHVQIQHHEDFYSISSQTENGKSYSNSQSRMIIIKYDPHRLIKRSPNSMKNEGLVQSNANFLFLVTFNDFFDKGH